MHAFSLHVSIVLQEKCFSDASNEANSIAVDERQFSNQLFKYFDTNLVRIPEVLML